MVYVLGVSGWETRLSSQGYHSLISSYRVPHSKPEPKLRHKYGLHLSALSLMEDIEEVSIGRTVQKALSAYLKTIAQELERKPKADS